jgi:hypothetical protein
LTDEPVLYTEPGSTWWPVLWGPLFAVVGAVTETFSGPVHGLIWALIGLGLAGMSAGWVKARRRVCSLSLTPTALRQGEEVLAVDRIAKVTDEEMVVYRPLGGGWTVPRKTEAVPLELVDGTKVLAWARDAHALRDALGPLVEVKP